MTSDTTVLMEIFSPQESLKDQGVVLDLIETNELELLKASIFPPFDPLASIPVLEQPRIKRLPGTDIRYWTLVNIRRKQTKIS